MLNTVSEWFNGSAYTLKKTDYSVLLLGPTGAGKSSLLNFLTCMVPPESLTSASFAKPTVQSSASAKSVTRNTVCHVIETDTMRINLFDTPGFGDTDGIAQDCDSARNILASIFKYTTTLNAIFIVINGTNYRINPAFVATLKQLASQFIVNDPTSTAPETIPVVVVATHVGIGCEGVDVSQMKQALDGTAYVVDEVLFDNVIHALRDIDDPEAKFAPLKRAMYKLQYDKFIELFAKLPTLPKISLVRLKECYERRVALSARISEIIASISNLINICTALEAHKKKTTQIVKVEDTHFNTLCLLHALLGTCHCCCSLNETIKVTIKPDSDARSVTIEGVKINRDEEDEDEPQPLSNIDVAKLTAEQLADIQKQMQENNKSGILLHCNAFNDLGNCARAPCIAEKCGPAVHFAGRYHYETKQVTLLDAMAKANVKTGKDIKSMLTVKYTEIGKLIEDVVNETDPHNLFIFTEIFQYVKQILAENEKLAQFRLLDVCQPLRNFLDTQFPDLIGKKLNPTHNPASSSYYYEFKDYYSNYGWGALAYKHRDSQFNLGSYYI